MDSMRNARELLTEALALLNEYPWGSDPRTLDRLNADAAKLDDTDLEGAGDHGPDEGAYVADAAEFAKRWNDWSPNIRERWVEQYVATSQAATRCIISDHDRLLEEVGSLGQALAKSNREAELAISTIAHMVQTWTTPTENERLVAEIERLENQVQELTEWADE